MKHTLILSLLAATALTGAIAIAQELETPPAPVMEPEAPKAPGKLEVTVNGITDGGAIPTRFAYCKPDGRGQTRDADNISPEISWKGAPEGTKSYAIMMVDKDVPLDFGPANQPGQEIKEDAPRQDFYHWLVVDIPASLGKIPEGKASNGITPKGKIPGETEYGITGKNDYTKMGSFGGGYDGPCPPWNDKRLHHYTFRVYAIDVPTLKAPTSGFAGEKMIKATKGHILAVGEVVGTYSNNVDVLGSPDYK